MKIALKAENFVPVHFDRGQGFRQPRAVLWRLGASAHGDGIDGVRRRGAVPVPLAHTRE